MKNLSLLFVSDNKFGGASLDDNWWCNIQDFKACLAEHITVAKLIRISRLNLAVEFVGEISQNIDSCNIIKFFVLHESMFAGFRS